MPQLFSALRVLGRHTVMKSALMLMKKSRTAAVGRFAATVGVALSAALIISACQQSPTAPGSVGNATAVPGQLAVKGGSKASKVDVCHREGNGSYHLINVSGNALSAHLGHGDGQPGDGTFDGACEQVVVEPPETRTASVGGNGVEASGLTVTLSCPEGTVTEVISGLYGLNCDGVVASTGEPDQTAHLALTCNAQTSCVYSINAGVCGLDPVS